jgi:hypothetical protein
MKNSGRLILGRISVFVVSPPSSHGPHFANRIDVSSLSFLFICQQAKLNLTHRFLRRANSGFSPFLCTSSTQMLAQTDHARMLCIAKRSKTA